MSELSDTFSAQLQLGGLAISGRFTAEYRFEPTRKWRFDFAWPELMIAAEVEGGTWQTSRHTNPIGFERDCEKYNRASQLGWRVFRFTGDMVRDGRAFAMMSDVLIPF
jgi:hypothetical protein